MKFLRAYVHIITLFVLFNVIQNCAEGFAAGTLVKVPNGYVKIEDVKVGELVICWDDTQQFVARPIFFITKKRVSRYACIVIDDETIKLSGKQKLYNMASRSWTTVRDLKNMLVKLRNEPIDLYMLSVEEYHNFFVSKADICAHNFIPAIVAGISFLFGSGIEIAGVSCGLASLGTYLGYRWHKNKHGSIEVGQVSFGGGMMPEDPDDEKKRKRDQARNDYRFLTNKEARKLADEMGYKEIKSHPCGDTRNKPVFTNGKNYISPDVDGHNGGMWKLFGRSGERIGTYNIDLTVKIGK
jgi:Novel toxin 21